LARKNGRENRIFGIKNGVLGWEKAGNLAFGPDFERGQDSLLGNSQGNRVSDTFVNLIF
jgi:hypothetical protein